VSAPEWRKGSRSGTQDNSDCVELARLGDGVGVRDSKNPGAGHLSVSTADLASLVGRIRAGDLDL
jgi:hypothetical protein